ncbi:hypothetical protein FLL45_01590 [Aliikangiella marina]|uniref:Uncharacterized protein n=1 Tax=Aliikangiella marina TaxID=1712262 RepID=A0A545THH5_9GAMM|nr:hypothetical protein [Aliikangiella marina]TQV76680.1 hypothetical protein FLL45_01590 [Aliikangiella marina]
MIEKQIQATLKEMECSACEKGVFRLALDLAVEDTNPKQWLHACSHCKREVYLTKVYPIIEYKDRDFMLADSLRFERSSDSISLHNNK